MKFNIIKVQRLLNKSSFYNQAITKILKKRILYALLLSLSLGFNSCETWLDKEPSREISETQAFSSIAGVNSVLANLYGRIKSEQDFVVWNDDAPGIDLLRWDEAISGSPRGENNLPADYGTYYRTYWDYNLIRDLNLFIERIDVDGASLAEKSRKYFKAEARFLRAYTYFEMVKRMGGVPLITQSFTFNTGDDPSTFSKSRNKEIEIYDFIASEVDLIKEDLNAPIGGTSMVKDRASKGAALALKSRAMLYAASIAKYTPQRSELILSTNGGEIGIPQDLANGYFQKSLDASIELINMNIYSLYNKNTDKAANFYEALTKNDLNNPESIFVKDYDGSFVKNIFTSCNMPRTLREDKTRESEYTNPTLNLVESFENTDGSPRTLKTKNGTETLEDLNQNSSTSDFVVYDNALDIFAKKDPRLFGTVIVPGASFNKKPVELWAGLAIWNSTKGGYDFKSVTSVTDFESPDPSKRLYDGRQITGQDGPLNADGGITRSGFTLRKYVDETAGAGTAGASKVAYVLYRYAEVLLNAAEASLELGLSQGDVQGYINQVRTRAGLPELSSVTMDDIKQERKVELAFEDQRFYDLKRWRLADQIWNGDINTASSVMYALWPYKIYRPGDATDGKWIFRRAKAVKKVYPLKFLPANYYSKIPDDAMGKNKLLIQNPN